MSPFLKKSFATITVVSALASVVATGREQPSSIVEPAAPRVDTRLQAQDADIDLGKLEERQDEGAKVDAFAPRNFAPVVPPQAAAAPAKREAPPLPFKYLGKMVEDGKLSVFLTNGDESITVHAGERVGDYRVDKITEAEVRFTYLPLKTKQSLPL
ncbi:MAG TPA: hypothetical protein VNU64_08750 [Burkholderiales bacterium]|nr:hypothetical protein [Burkholderiales bacterium]